MVHGNAFVDADLDFKHGFSFSWPVDIICGIFSFSAIKDADSRRQYDTGADPIGSRECSCHEEKTQS